MISACGMSMSDWSVINTSAYWHVMLNDLSIEEREREKERLCSVHAFNIFLAYKRKSTKPLYILYNAYIYLYIEEKSRHGNSFLLHAKKINSCLHSQHNSIYRALPLALSIDSALAQHLTQLSR